MGKAYALPLSKRKAPKGVFRALRSARRLTQPSLRELLEKLDQNFHRTDENPSRSNFFVSPFGVVGPKRLREQLLGCSSLTFPIWSTDYETRHKHSTPTLIKPATKVLEGVGNFFQEVSDNSPSSKKFLTINRPQEASDKIASPTLTP